MNPRGLLAAALDEIAAYRLRTAISVLSIVIGVATLTLIVALGDIGRAATQAVIEREAGRAATLELSSERPASQFISTVLPRLLLRLDRYGAVHRSVMLMAPARATFVAGSQPIAAYGVDPSLDQVRRLRLLAGRWLEISDSKLYAPVIVLNRPMLAAAGLALEQAVGQQVPLAIASPGLARIIGVIDDGQHDGRIYLSSAFLLRPNTASAIAAATVVVTVDPFDADALASRVISDLSHTGEGRLRVERLDGAEDFSSIVTTLQLVLSAIAAISLISGSLGILNLGLVTVRHRAREFAIRRSFGASRREVFVLVLAESLVTTTLAGLLGIALAGLATAALPILSSSIIDAADLPPFPMTAAIAGLAVAVTVGLAAGAIPAMRATQLSIIETIRS
jgi:putative ABC transport system permease protein